MQICVSAGEVSGDQILAPILSGLSKYHELTFAGIAGTEMEIAGVYPLFSAERLSVMGVIEVLPRLSELVSIRRQMIHYLEVARPRALITCDSPDFNLPLQQKAKSLGIPAIHIVSPSVWAWRQNRIPKIAASLDALLCLFPFEPALYAQTGLNIRFIGHPLATQVEFNPDSRQARMRLGLPTEGKLLAMLPGSRRGEVERLLPVFLDAFDRLALEIPDLFAVIPAATDLLSDLILECIGSRRVFLVRGKSQQVLAAANTVLLASGTAALEATLTGRPSVAAYRLNPWTYRMVKSRLKSRFVTLPNFLANQALIPELIQNEVTVENLVSHLREPLENGASSKFISGAKRIYESLCGPVTERAVDFISEVIGCA